MINLGIIGTNWITHQFVQAALSTKKYELTAVYSRHLEKAQEFGSHYEGDIEFATDLKTFFNIAHMDTVYIASPNSLHFSQTKQAILAGKNVIVEKPAFSTPKEMDEIIHLANEHNVYFFEAARNIHESGFKKIADYLPLKDEIIGANFSYMKYSSRYDQVWRRTKYLLDSFLRWCIDGFRCLPCVCNCRLVWNAKRSPLFPKKDFYWCGWSWMGNLAL